MNNSDHNDFTNWQNGDDEPNNPNNWIPGGFFYYGPSENFKKMFGNNQNNEEFLDNMKEYLNMDDILNQWAKQLPPKNNQRRNKSKNNLPKTTIFSQEDYMKLIEIRGYLAITEQMAHVKALDKLLLQIKIVPKDEK